jgi:hypothetical protein
VGCERKRGGGRTKNGVLALEVAREEGAKDEAKRSHDLIRSTRLLTSTPSAHHARLSTISVCG